MSITSEIERIKTNIANAYTKAEEKGAILPEVLNSANLSDTIETIEQGSSNWQPQSDWWDIEKILEEDTEDYPAKMICLLDGSYATSTFTQHADRNPFSKIKTSDGATYTTTATHTWDTSQDKVTSLGQRTRYFIAYYDKTDFNIKYITFPSPKGNGGNPLYYIFKNCNVAITTLSGSSIFSNANNLECIKVINGSITSGVDTAYGDYISLNSYVIQELPDKIILNSNRLTFGSCYSLRKIPIIEGIENATNLQSFLDGCYHIKKIEQDLNSGLITSFNCAFRNATGLIYIKSLNFESVTNVGSMFQGTRSLVEISEISNIKISGISFNDCTALNHDTLIRILEALEDYSGGETHTITLGSTNLAKLTETELAIGQNKNWTIS